MSSQNAIGVFDSGLGGLTAVRELARIMPEEDLVYFGDTGRVPYGSRSRETIISYARQDVAFLNTFDPKAIVIACNSADTVAGARVQREYDLPICGAVRPAAKRAALATKNQKIGVIGTNATVKAKAYDGIIREFNPGAQIMSIACPLLVPLVENFRTRPGDQAAEIIISDKGCGIENVRQAREPMFTTGGADRSGMGFTIMESFMDGMTVRSKPGKGTTVVLQKVLEARQEV